MKQFFESIPVSVEEAARIDGAGIFRTFWTIVLPMARPALVTLFILSFQGSWNEFGSFIVSTQSPGLRTLTTGIAGLFSGQLGSGNQFPLKLAAAILMTIPVAVIFFIFQRKIMNTTEGGEKG
jgi:multiple sugar transport system permease protein